MLCIQTQAGRFIVSFCNLRLIGYNWLQSREHVEISCFVLGNQRRCRKPRIPTLNNNV